MPSIYNALFRPAIFDEPQEPFLLASYFEHLANGVFVDVGANDPETSVSAAFESKGWTGLIFEPLPQSASKLRAVRKNPVVEAACTSVLGAQKKTAHLHLAGHGGQQSSLDEAAQDPLSRTSQSIEVRLTTLDSELGRHRIERIDFLAIDVEGHELEVLNGLDLLRYRPKLVLLEDWGRDFSRHRAMSAAGYKLVRRTSFNSWYVPSDTVFAVSLLGWLQLFRKYVLGMPGRRLRLWRHARSLRSA